MLKMKNNKIFPRVPERSKILLNATTHRNTSESQRVSRHNCLKIVPILRLKMKRLYVVGKRNH